MSLPPQPPPSSPSSSKLPTTTTTSDKNNNNMRSPSTSTPTPSDSKSKAWTSSASSSSSSRHAHHGTMCSLPLLASLALSLLACSSTTTATTTNTAANTVESTTVIPTTSTVANVATAAVAASAAANCLKRKGQQEQIEGTEYNKKRHTTTSTTSSILLGLCGGDDDSTEEKHEVQSSILVVNENDNGGGGGDGDGDGFGRDNDKKEEKVEDASVGGIREEEGKETSFVSATSTESAPAATGVDDGGEGSKNNNVDDDGEEDKDDSHLTFHASKPGDGSESDPDGIPNRFLIMQKKNRPNAKKAFQHTLKFRHDYHVDTILSRPHPKFDQVKTVFPHYFCGRDVANNPIFVQRFGYINLELAKVNNVSNEEILLHYVYVLEYCWNILEPKLTPKGEEGVMTSILDMDGVSWKMLQRPDILGFVKKMVSMVSAHYPTRSYKTLIVNAPRWFHGIYRILKPLLRESTKKKIDIMSGGFYQDEVLIKVLGINSCPRELLSDSYKQQHPKENDDTPTAAADAAGGDDGAAIPVKLKVLVKDAEPGPDSQIERDLRAFCIKRLQKAGMNMKPVSQL